MIIREPKTKINWVNWVQLVFMLLLMSHSTVAYTAAEKSVATAVLVKGEVVVKTSKTSLKIKSGHLLEEKDVVNTAADSFVQIKFSDGTVVSLGENTSLNIKEFVDSDANSTSNLSVTKGSFKAITGKIGKLNPDRFKISTPTSTIGIRGTIFKGAISQDKEVFATLQGKIVVTENSSGFSVELPAGMMATVISGQPIDLPKPYDEAAMKEALGIKEESSNEDDSEEDEESSAEGADLDDVLEVKLNQDKVDNLDGLLGGVKLVSWYASSSNGFNFSVSAIDWEQGIVLDESVGLRLTTGDSWVSAPVGSNKNTYGKDSSYEYIRNWGYWGNQMVGSQVEGYYLEAYGQQAGENHFNKLISEGKTVTYNYSGSMLGSLNGGDADAKLGSFNLNFNFSGGGLSVAGQADVSNLGQIDLVGGKAATSGFYVTSQTSGIDGGMSGLSFGNNAEEIGGIFAFEKGSDKASGVFKGRR